MKTLALTIAVLIFAQASHADRYIVESDSSELEAETARVGAKTVRALETSRGLVVEVDHEEKLLKLKSKLPSLRYQKDIEVTVAPIRASAKPAPQQPAELVPWGISKIGSHNAWSITRGAGVKVCVVDTGIDKTHPDLQANLVGGRNFVVIKGTVSPSQWNDDNGHGSHVAGTIAALDNAIGVVGVAPEAKLYAVKVLNSRGSGYLSDVADGVTECVRAGSHVINMSLGATSDPNLSSPLKTAVENAIAAGVVVVVAAGNEGQDIQTKVPAGYPQTIAVAAVDSSLNFPSWSNFGLDSDDYSAPGVSVYSTWKSNGYNTISGTSMAAPHVAGVVALKISSGSLGLVATDLGRSLSTQGAGLIDALGTVSNQP